LLLLLCVARSLDPGEDYGLLFCSKNTSAFINQAHVDNRLCVPHRTRGVQLNSSYDVIIFQIFPVFGPPPLFFVAEVKQTSATSCVRPCASIHLTPLLAPATRYYSH